MQRCDKEFEKLAKEAFPYVIGVLKFLVVLCRGSVYSAKGIEKALRRVHGHQKFTDPSYSHTIGAKVGILTANTRQPAVHLFNNYNGHGAERVGYHVRSGCESVETWEVYVVFTQQSIPLCAN